MNKIIYAFFISLVLSIAVTAYSDSVQADLQDNLTRLHIIANSDGDADQAVKLKVRDAALNQIRKKINSENGVSNIINELPELEKTANETLRKNGFAYTAKAVYGKFDFPKKTYKNMTLPAGEYYGVRIILGSGSGHNWWCVLYPPLCTSGGDTVTLDEKSQKLLRDSLSPEAYDIITSSDKGITVKFKTVELIQEIRQKLKQIK